MATTLGIDGPLLLGAVLVLAALLVSALTTRRVEVPGALLFLVLGMLVGDEGLGLVRLSDAELVRDVGVAALLLILLEGGLTTTPADLRRASLPGFLLSTVGVLLTSGVTALGAWLLLDVDLITAAILGAVVGSTDAAAIFSMMRTSALPPRIASLLRVESGLNDPLAATLTIGLVATALGRADVGDWVRFALVQPIAGLVVGVGVGWLGAVMLARLRLAATGFYPLSVTAFGALSYGLTVAVGGSGFLAVFLTGLVISTVVPRHRRLILDVHEATGTAAEIGLFLLLGLLVFPSRLPAVALSAALVALVLTLVARPIAVWVCTLRQGFGWRERTVMSVGGLKGAVPIVLATFPLTAGVPGAAVIFDTVFFVTLVSLAIQGAAVLPVIRRLGIATTVPTPPPLAEAMPLHDVEVDLVELEVTGEMAIAGRPLREHRASPGLVVTAIVRGDRVLVPSGATVPQPGDVLLITAGQRGDAVADCTAWANGRDAGAPAP